MMELETQYLTTNVLTQARITNRLDENFLENYQTIYPQITY